MIESLKSKTEFAKVYKKGKVFGNRLFVLRYIKNDKSTNRLGVVISKKVSKKAVVRNKLRRQIKEHLSQLETRLEPGYDFIVTVKPICAEQSYQALAKSLNHLFYSKGLLKHEKHSNGPD